MTPEEIYIKLRDEMTAENESSSSPERIFIKNDGQTICTIGMNRSHEIIFVEFKPSQKDLSGVEREGFVHPHPVEMLHDAGWRQAQLTTWEEAEKLLDIIHRSYKKKKKSDDGTARRGGRLDAIRAAKLRRMKTAPPAARAVTAPLRGSAGGRLEKPAPAGKTVRPPEPPARKERGRPAGKASAPVVAAPPPKKAAPPAAPAKATSKPAKKAKVKVAPKPAAKGPKAKAKPKAKPAKKVSPAKPKAKKVTPAKKAKPAKTAGKKKKK